MRVFVGRVEVAGIAAGWVDALREAGVEADLVCNYSHPFSYTAGPLPSWVPALWARVGRWRQVLPPQRRVTRAIAATLHQVSSWLVLTWALSRYDAFVFLYGETITNTLAELRLLRWCGKRVVVAFVGSDARPAYIDGARFPTDKCFEPEVACRVARQQRLRVQRLERHAVVLSPRTTGQFLTRPFVSWYAIGIACRAQPAPQAPIGRVVRVLHSPSNAVLKGSAEILAAAERLRARGVPIELMTIAGRPNAEVLRALCDCHLVVDQLYSDIPMAAFAAEAASLGRPVIVCGVAADQAVKQTLPGPLPPTVYVRPEQFEGTLERLVGDAARRLWLGEAGAKFIAQHWSPAAVGARLLRVLSDDVPRDWWCRPDEVDHLAGCGLPEAVTREHVRALVDCCGVSALQLDDKPKLRQAFVDFAYGVAPHS